MLFGYIQNLGRRLEVGSNAIEEGLSWRLVSGGFCLAPYMVDDSPAARIHREASVGHIPGIQFRQADRQLRHRQPD
ncbi:MAG: hypothetical protein H6945_13220 [Zoogloeaceae bacterium]|nr:hypothetical protein [Zoogloeaceae bacterium]